MNPYEAAKQRAFDRVDKAIAATQIHRISDKQPEFPCWLWHEGTWRWIRHEAFPHHDLLHNAYTHWHPDQPSAPIATPPTEQATEGGVTTERDVRNHVSAPAQGETPDTLYAAALDTLKDMSAQVAQLTGAQDRMDAEIAMLTADLFRATSERDQARQDLEERCAENDRERAAHLQAYQEACKERDEARAELPKEAFASNVAILELQSKLTAAEAEMAELRKDKARFETWRDACLNGWDVYQMLTKDMKKKTSAENVADALDAVARCARRLIELRDAALSKSAQGEGEK